MSFCLMPFIEFGCGAIAGRHWLIGISKPSHSVLTSIGCVLRTRSTGFTLFASVMVLGGVPQPLHAQSADHGHALYALTDAFTRLSIAVADDPDDAAMWSPVIRPGSFWNESWTALGLEARYCDGNLLVYTGARAKGVGSDLDQVRSAGMQVSGAAGRVGKTLSSHILVRGNGEEISLPPCLNASYGQPVPSDRIAMFTVFDLSTVMDTEISYNSKKDACPAGQHGSGINMSQKVTVTTDTKGVSDTHSGVWKQGLSFCDPDYSYWDKFELACSWVEGPPHNATMYGINTYRIPVHVTAAGKTYGTPDFISSTCFDVLQGKPAPIPTPTTTKSNSIETQSDTVPCGDGYTGTRTSERSRLVQIATVSYPWDADDFSSTRSGPWSEWEVVEDDCAVITPSSGHWERIYRGDPHGSLPSQYSGSPSCSSSPSVGGTCRPVNDQCYTRNFVPLPGGAYFFDVYQCK